MSDPKPTEPSRPLVDRASAGDTIAVDELVARHLPGLRAFVRLRAGPMLRAKESTSDIVQSACRDVLQNMQLFRYGGEAGFKAWLYENAARKVADRAEFWRAEKRDPAREAMPLRPTSADSSQRAPGEDAGVAAVYRSIATPSQNAMGHELLERLERAFEKIDEADREIIVLARVVGLSHAEIAKRLGLTAGAARVRLFRALSDLAVALRD